MPTAAILNQERERWARKQASVLMASQATFAGALPKQVNEVGQFAVQTVAFSGTVVKQTGDVLNATVGFTATNSKQTGNVFTASMGFVGTVAKQISKSLLASSSFSGKLAKQVGAVLSSAFGFSASAIKQIGAALSSSFGFFGTISKQVGISLPGSFGFSGKLAKQIGAPFSASFGFVASAVKQTGAVISAAFGLSASGIRQVGAALSSSFGFSGLTSKRINKAVNAATSAYSGLLSQARVRLVAFLASMAAFASAASKQTGISRSANLSLTGTTGKQINVSLKAQSSFSAALLSGHVFNVIFNAVMSTLSAIWTTLKQLAPVLPPFQSITIGRMVSSFGVDLSTPSQIAQFSSTAQTFSRTGNPFPSFMGRADGWQALGQRAMPGELLVAPGNGGLSGSVYYAVAGGDATIPASASNLSLSITLFQNYFSADGSIQSDALATAIVPVIAGHVTPWSLICQLSGNGPHNGILRADQIINGGLAGAIFSNRSLVEPKLQLSIGVSLQGSGPDSPLVTLKQFDLQQK